MDLTNKAIVDLDDYNELKEFRKKTVDNEMFFVRYVHVNNRSGVYSTIGYIKENEAMELLVRENESIVKAFEDYKKRINKLSFFKRLYYSFFGTL